MEPINGLEKLARLIRSKASRFERNAASTQAFASDCPQLSPQMALDQELRAKVRQMTKLSTSPQIIGQAVIGTMLAREFNNRLHNEPKFNALVLQVYRHITSEPKINAAFKIIIKQLEH